MANFLFVLSREDNETATRAFHLAKSAHAKGHQTHLFLIDGGVIWADVTRNFKINTVNGDCPYDYFPYLVENKVEIDVCEPCFKARGMDDSNFFSNMTLSTNLIELAEKAKLFYL